MNDLVGFTVLLSFILMIYSGFKKQTFSDTLKQIIEMFKGEKEDGK